MIAADKAIQRPSDARLLVVDPAKHINHAQRSRFIDSLRAGDLVIANDAGTIPASLRGVLDVSGEPVEVRLVGRDSLKPEDVCRFKAVVFGAGDFRMRTEDRPAPPSLSAGSVIKIGSLRATVEDVLGHSRLVSIKFDGPVDSIWAGLARFGRPIQYSHLRTPLELWDVWTRIAGPPVAFEAPSAGFVLDWRLVSEMRARGVEFETITHAAGISSTGDPELDLLLPFDEPYLISEATAAAIERTKLRGGRIVAIGTTVVRALEHAALNGGTVKAGEGLATQKIGSESRLLVVDAILSGTHEPGTSHYELLRAFADDATLSRACEEMEAIGYRTHEFGDSVLIERC